MTYARILGIVLALAAAPLRADILLDGHNHVGDCDDTGGGCTGFTPLDPVSRDNMFNTPIAFHLTTTTTIDKVRLDNPISLDGKLQVYIQPLFGSLVFRSGTLSGSTYDLVPDLVLSPGYYSILPDGGCSAVNGGGTFFYTGCAGSGDNDHGYSAITLISPQTSTSRMLIQRRHPGNSTDPANDNDTDDDYDFADAASPYYPDIAEGHPLDIPFNIDQNRRLSEIRFYRARDVDAPLSTILIDGFAEYGLLDTGDPLEVNPTIISTNQLLLAGNHTLRVQLGVISGADVDSFSWDNIILTFTNAAPGGSLGRFNAVEVGFAATNGAIKTKIANQGFNFDLYAINPLGTGANTGYTGTVNIELLNAGNDSGAFDIYGCRSSWTVAANLGSASFVGADNGKKTISGATYPNALKVARIRATDTSSGASGCSFDAFAIRPKDFAVVATDTDPATAGLVRNLPTGPYTETTTPLHKAGQPFTLTATPRANGGGTLTGYDGQPEVTAPQLELGSVLGTAAPPAPTWTWSGSDLQTDVTYSEVGAVRLKVADLDFAAVDAGDSSPAERTASGEVNVGRFIPDHIKVTKAIGIESGCGTFTYIGQPFTYSAGAVTLTAENGLTPAGTTQGYTGALFKLPSVSANYTIYDDPVIAGTPTLNLPDPGPYTVSDNTDGTGTITLPTFNVVRPATLLDPFAAEIGIAFTAFTDGDGVATTESPIVMGTATSGNGAPFDPTTSNQMRYGRMYIQPSFGSETQDLSVPLRTEYWDGTTFIPTGAGACTPLIAADITAGNLAVGQTVGLTANGGPVTNWTIDLSAPGDVREVDLSLDLSTVGPYLFLLADTDADGNFDNNPSADASFGFYDRSDDNRIYQREVFR